MALNVEDKIHNPHSSDRNVRRRLLLLSGAGGYRSIAGRRYRQTDGRTDTGPTHRRFPLEARGQRTNKFIMLNGMERNCECFATAGCAFTAQTSTRTHDDQYYYGVGWCFQICRKGRMSEALSGKCGGQ